MINKYPELPHQSPNILFCFCKDNRVISCFFSFQFLSPNSASHFLLQRMFVVAGRCHPPATIKRTFMMSCGLLPLIPLNKLLSLQPRGSQSCSARRLAVVLCCAKKLIWFCWILPWTTALKCASAGRSSFGSLTCFGQAGSFWTCVHRKYIHRPLDLLLLWPRHANQLVHLHSTLYCCTLLSQPLRMKGPLAAFRFGYFVVCKATTIVTSWHCTCLYVGSSFYSTYRLWQPFPASYTYAMPPMSWLTCVHMCTHIHTPCSHDLTGA